MRYPNLTPPDAIVNDFNAAFPLRTEFLAPIGSSAFLNLVVKDTPVLCSVNPPELDVYCSASMSGWVSETAVTTLDATTSSLNSPYPDFELVNNGVQVPVDGCYRVIINSNITSIHYDSNAWIDVTLVRSGTGYASVIPVYAHQGSTGILSILGPYMTCSASITPIFAVVTCKAGDILTVALSASIDVGIPWVAGTTLIGWQINWGTNFSVTLIAEIEA